MHISFTQNYVSELRRMVPLFSFICNDETKMSCYAAMKIFNSFMEQKLGRIFIPAHIITGKNMVLIIKLATE